MAPKTRPTGGVKAKGNAATTPPKEPTLTAYERAKCIYDLTPREEEYANTLPESEREDFRFFTIGVKLADNWGEDWKPISRNLNTIGRWEKAHADAGSIEINIERAENQPDPRLQARIFHLRPQERDFLDGLPEDARDDFYYFLVYAKTMSCNVQLAEQNIFNQWNKESEEKRKKYAATGKSFYDRFQTKRERRAVSGPNAHRYMDTVAGVEGLKPTEADLRHLEERFKGPWTFEKTFSQNMCNSDLLYRRIIHLFVRVDDDGNIQERLVVKIIGERSIEIVKQLTSDEFLVHARLTCVNCPYILACYGSSVRKRATEPQLGYGYLEYAPFGDLDQFIQQPPDPQALQVPEPFIWIIFRGLAEALYAMYTGYKIAPEVPFHDSPKGNETLIKVPGWKPYINLDVKPMNVVLSHSQDHWPAYKTPKMIDFGIVFSKDERPSAAHIRNGCGTYGYMPPEQRPGTVHTSAGITEATPIFNLGLIILSLMEWKERLYEDDMVRNGLRLSRDYEGHYDAHLEHLVSKCLELPPESRPTLHNILYATRKGLERWERLYGSIKDVKQDQLPRFARLQFAKEEFKIGEPAPRHWIVKKRKAEEDLPPPAKSVGARQTRKKPGVDEGKVQKKAEQQLASEASIAPRAPRTRKGVGKKATAASQSASKPSIAPSRQKVVAKKAAANSTAPAVNSRKRRLPKDIEGKTAQLAEKKRRR